MLNLNELKNNLFIGDYGNELLNYNDSSYICDAISEIADNNTSIYYYDIKQFMMDNFDAVEDAINEFGWDGCGSDLYKAGQIAEYITIERDLYNNLDDIIKYLAYDYLINIGFDTLDDNIIDNIDNELLTIDNNNYIGDIYDTVNTVLEENNIKIGDGIAGLEAKERDIVLSHLFFHVSPRSKHPLTPHTVHFIHNAV